MSRRTVFILSACLLFASSLTDLLLCPHSKVEESFQLQATHDLYYHGLGPILRLSLSHEGTATGNVTSSASSDILPYDHLQYPGVVPRTFAGPIILSVLSHTLLYSLGLLNIAVGPLFVQFLARFCLMALNVLGWIRLALAVDRRRTTVAGPDLSVGTMVTTGSWLLLITACQFHIPFYSSRMLPNTFALAVVLQSFAYWVQGRVQLAASLLVGATAVFRCDLLLLLGPVGLSWLCFRQLTIPQALRVGILTGIVALTVTVPFDSLLWQRPLWPEGEVFYFNTILGKSKEWGTSPWHWYFSSALPKAMLLTLLLVPLSTFRFADRDVAVEGSLRGRGKKRWPPMTAASLIDTEWLQYTLPVFGFVALYSFLGHKEMRFIFPALPVLNLSAAVGMAKLARLAQSRDDGKRKKDDDHGDSTTPMPWLARIGFLGGVLCMVSTLCGSLVFVAVSRSNYPGGDALLELSSYIRDLAETNAHMPPPPSATVHVHIDVAAAMSGVSLFGQRAAAEASSHWFQWKFSKDGYEEGHSVAGREGYEAFTHLLSEDSAVGAPSFHVIRTIQGRPRLSLRDRGVVTENAIYVLERNGWRDSLN